MEWKSHTGGSILLRQGDITQIAVDAMANAANSSLAGGGGVDGAIHRAGGPAIMRELDVIRREIGRCPAGSTVATGAGKLPAKYVFHAVGPIYKDGKQGEPELLASCYRTCLAMAEERGVVTISFPAISAGVYGYPMEEAAEIAVREAKAHLDVAGRSVREVLFALFGAQAMKAFLKML